MRKRPVKNPDLIRAKKSLLAFLTYRCVKSLNIWKYVLRKSRKVKGDNSLIYMCIYKAYEYMYYESVCKAFIWKICEVTSFRQFNVIQKLIKKLVQIWTSLSNDMKELQQNLDRNMYCSNIL